MKKILILLFLSPVIISETYVCNVNYVKIIEEADYEKIIEIRRDKNIFNAKVTSITTINTASKSISEFPLKLIFENEGQIDLVGPTLEFVYRIYKDGPYLYMADMHKVGPTRLKERNNCIKV